MKCQLTNNKWFFDAEAMPTRGNEVALRTTKPAVGTNCPEDADESSKYCLNEVIIILLKTLNPIAPHISEYLWNDFYGDFSNDNIESSWPEVREDLLEVSEFDLVVQVNGKVRGKITIDKGLTQQEIEVLAKSIDNVSANLKGADIKKTIYIKEKIINFVF